MSSVVKAEDRFRGCLKSKNSVSGRETREGIPPLCCHEMRTPHRHSQYVSTYMRQLSKNQSHNPHKPFSEGNHQYPTSLQEVQAVAPIDAPFPRAFGQVYIGSKSKTDPLPSLPLLLAITFLMEPKSFFEVSSPTSPECGSCFNEVPRIPDLQLSSCQGSYQRCHTGCKSVCRPVVCLQEARPQRAAVRQKDGSFQRASLVCQISFLR